MGETTTQSVSPRTVAAPGHAPSTVTWVDTTGAIPADVWAQCFPAPLEGLWWYQALERAGLEDQFTFAYAVITQGGRTVGIAPAFRMDLPLEIVMPDEIVPYVSWIGRWIPALRYQKTFFVGSPCAEEGTIGLVSGVTLADVLPVLMPAVDAKAKAMRVDMVVWKDVPDAAKPAFEQAAPAGRLFTTPSFPGTEMHTLPKNFDAYLAGLTGNHRYQLKKKLKLSKAALALDTTVVQAPDAALQAEVWALFMQTYEKATTRFERLTPAFFAELAKAPTTHFILLRARDTGKLVAFMLCYFEGGIATNKFIGIDYTLGEKVFLYFRLFEEFLIWATGKGATALRSGQTGYRAKFDLEHEPVALTNFARHRVWLLHKIYSHVGKTITWSTLDPDLKTWLDAKARKGEPSGGDV